MDSPKKVTIKHLEFQLQREKALTREFEDKNKLLHAQIARFEQEKAELRREKLLLSDEAKKVSKLEDRVHSLLREVELKDNIISTERSKLACSKNEIEQVRSNANTSIASWVAAEEEWIAEQASLKGEVDQLKQHLLDTQQRMGAVTAENDELNRLLDLERQTIKKKQTDNDVIADELSKLKESHNEVKNRNYELESKIYSLDMTLEKIKEENLTKDENIDVLEGKNAQLLAAEERMERTVNDLNDRLNVSKTKLLDAKSDIEKLNCDVRDSARRVQMVERELQAARHDECLAKQSLSVVQRTLEESRDRCSLLTSSIQEKSSDVRRLELLLNETNAKLTKSEQRCVDLTFQSSALRTEVDALKLDNLKLDDLRQVFECENKRLVSVNNTANSLVDSKEEELTLFSSRFNDQLLSHGNIVLTLEEDVKSRQKMIDELTAQVREMNDKNAFYFEQMKKESRALAECRAQVDLVEFASQNLRHANAYLSTLCDFLESRASIQDESMHDASDIMSWMRDECYTMMSAQSNVLRMNCDTTAHLTHKLAQASDDLQQTLTEVGRLKDMHSAATERLESVEAQLLQASARDTHQVEEINHLQEECNSFKRREMEHIDFVSKLQKDCAALKKSTSEAIRTNADCRDSYLKAAVNAMFLFDSHAESYTTYIESAHVLLIQEVDEMVATISHKLSREHTASSEAEKRYRNVLLDLQESRTLLCQQEVRESKRVGEAESLIAALQSDLSTAKSENERCARQVNNLLEQINVAKRNALDLQQTFQDTLNKEITRRKATEEHCEKVREGLNYELKRKCEYKDALEESKRLRGEVEACRTTEKSLAMQAIKKANAETIYWAKSFDKMKHIVESLKCRDICVPSVDPEALSRLKALESKTAPLEMAQPIDNKENISFLKRDRSCTPVRLDSA